MHALTVFPRQVVSAIAAVALALCALGADDATASNESVREISLEEALRIAVENNLSLASGSFDRLIARESIRIADAEFQPVFFARVGKTFDLSQNTSTLEQNATTEDDISRATVSVSQKLNTGAVVSFNGGTGRNSFDRSAQQSLFFDANAGISITQPLLRGAGFATNRITRKQAIIGADLSDLQFKARVLDIIQRTEFAFYNIAFAQENLEVRRSGVEAAERFVEENEARQRAGLATELDVMQSRVGLATRQAALIQARQLLSDTTDELLALLGDTEFSGLVRPKEVNFAQTEEVNVGKSYGLARNNDTAILQAEAQLQQLELGAKLAANNRRPQLDLGAGYGLTNKDDGYGSSIEGLSERNGYNWQLNLTLNVPWGLNEGRARLRQAEFSVEQQRAFLDQLEQDLLVQVRTAVRAVETAVESVDIANLATQLSGQEYQLEKARFDSGLSTSRLVVDAQQRENLSRVAETESRVRLKQNEALLRRIEGSSLQKFSLEIPAAE
jgi:outer membrane protein TolC